MGINHVEDVKKKPLSWKLNAKLLHSQVFSSMCVRKNQRNVCSHKSKKQTEVYLMPVIKHFTDYPTQTRRIFETLLIAMNCWNYCCDVRGINPSWAEPTMCVLWHEGAAFKSFWSHFLFFHFCTYTTYTSLFSISILQKWRGVKKIIQSNKLPYDDY